jgi:hypothetical protein
VALAEYPADLRLGNRGVYGVKGKAGSGAVPPVTIPGRHVGVQAVGQLCAMRAMSVDTEFMPDLAALIVAVGFAGGEVGENCQAR